MVPPNKLAEIGIEAFQLLEESIGPVPKAKMPLHSTFQQQLSSAQASCYTRETIECYTAAQKNKGVIMVQYFVNKPAPVATPVPRKYIFFKGFCMFTTLQ